MSTQINVTVDSGGLSEKARQLQTAARQAQLEKERILDLSAEALDKRVAAQAAKGLSPDGLPLYGSRFKQPEIERRPAANRDLPGPPTILLVPNQDFILTGGTSSSSIATNLPGIPTAFIGAKTKGIKNTRFFHSPLLLVTTNDLRERPLFFADGGPGGAPYLQSPVIAPTRQGASYGYLLDVVCDNPNALDFITASVGDTFKTQVLTVDGPVDPIQIKRPIHKLQEYTMEFYFFIDDAVGRRIAPRDESLTHVASVLAGVGFEYIQQGFNLGAKLCSIQIRSGIWASDIDEVNGEMSVFGSEGFFASVYFGGPGTGQPPSFGIPSAFTSNTWYHVAFVKTKTAQSLFFEGQLVASIASNFDTLKSLPDTVVTVAEVLLANGGEIISQPGIHGFRFTPKALYTGSFTPPVSITTL